MPLTAAASAREILVRLHDVMAARSSAQAKLDAVTRIIGEAGTPHPASVMDQLAVVQDLTG